MTITQRQRAEQTGAELLDLICDVVADGKLSAEETRRLDAWLQSNRQSEIPAVAFLADVIAKVLADGVLTDSEKTELHVALERVLPLTERTTAQFARRAAEKPKITRTDLEEMKVRRDERDTGGNEESFFDRGGWRTDPATDAQRGFIKSLGGKIGSAATKGDASDLIDLLLRERPISSRQAMVLRFWNRTRSPGEGPREISEWQEDFYTEDPDRKTAWELFKQESEDNGLQGDANRVPLGIGPQYLARVKAGGSAAIPKFRPNSSDVYADLRSSSQTGIKMVIGLLLLAAVVWFLARR